MKEKTLLLLWLTPVFSLFVHTFEGRVDLTIIKKLRNNLLFLDRELPLPCVVQSSRDFTIFCMHV